MLDLAIKLAVSAHKGQLDKAGKPYILHPLNLMLKFSEEELQIVSILHDVIEDSEITLEYLSELGFSKSVVDALDALTKKSHEDYVDFISRISENLIATRVKIEDLTHNLDITRLDTVRSDDLLRIEKYHNALFFLRNR